MKEDFAENIFTVHYLPAQITPLWKKPLNNNSSYTGGHNK